MDEDGDGTIPPTRNHFHGTKVPKVENQQKKLKKIIMSMCFAFIILVMLSIFAMAVGRRDNKGNRAASGNTVSKPAFPSDVPETKD